MAACSKAGREFGGEAGEDAGGRAGQDSGGAQSVSGASHGGTKNEGGAGSGADTAEGGDEAKGGTEQGGEAARGGAGTSGAGETGGTGGTGGTAPACPGQKACGGNGCAPLDGCCDASDCPSKPNTEHTCSDEHSCLYSCKANYGDCDGSKLSNGCEVNLLTGQDKNGVVEDCGKCETDCNFINQSPLECSTKKNVCELGKCTAAIFTHYTNPSDYSYHYTCKLEHPRATLVYGNCDIGCSYECDSGWNDCDNEKTNGCETPSASANESCYADPFWGGTFD